MSNSDIELIRDVFSANEYNYTIETLVCKRSINSKNPDSKTKEVIIRNYQTVQDSHRGVLRHLPIYLVIQSNLRRLQKTHRYYSPAILY